jgi:hypothetical protein
MAEVSKNIHQKLIEAGIPVKETIVTYLVPDDDEKAFKKQGVKKLVEYSPWSDYEVIFTDFREIKDEISLPLSISEVFMEIGKRLPSSVTIDLENKTYEIQNPTLTRREYGQLAKRYHSKFIKIMEENGIKDRFKP